MSIVGKFSTSGALLSLLCFKQPMGQLRQGIFQGWHCAPGALPALVWVIPVGLPVRVKRDGTAALTSRKVHWSPTQSSYKSLSPSVFFADVN